MFNVKEEFASIGFLFCVRGNMDILMASNIAVVYQYQSPNY